MPRTLEEKDWRLLLGRIRDEKCTPFIGPGACQETLALRRDMAQEWARDFDYPLEDSDDLVRVAQFLAVDQDIAYPKDEIAKRIKSTALPDFQLKDEPHGILADMPLPVYITTNYDDFMIRALEDRQRDPKREICRWNEYTEDSPSIFKGDPPFEPTAANPVVFHFHGHAGLPESLVLTEDDYLDFLVNVSKEKEKLPPRIQRALTRASLLFIGYKISDWDFRVLFRVLAGYLENSMTRGHVSVQIVPLGDEVSEEKKVKAQKYLDKYFDNLDTRVYWGTSQEFTSELRQRWEEFK